VALVAAVAVVLLGIAGLVAGARQDPAPETAPAGPSVGPISVTNVFVRQPASPEVAAAYLTMRNSGGTEDALVAVYSGAAKTTTLHAGSASGSMSDSGPIAIPANGVVTLSPGNGHIMFEGLTGPLRPGDRISLLLTFRSAGQLLVEAPVIAIGAPAPGGSTS
jgi:periplasmic copper chaperone A